jgi:hypothetical protein
MRKVHYDRSDNSDSYRTAMTLSEGHVTRHDVHTIRSPEAVPTEQQQRVETLTRKPDHRNGYANISTTATPFFAWFAHPTLAVQRLKR